MWNSKLTCLKSLPTQNRKFNKPLPPFSCPSVRELDTVTEMTWGEKLFCSHFWGAGPVSCSSEESPLGWARSYRREGGRATEKLLVDQSSSHSSTEGKENKLPPPNLTELFLIWSSKQMPHLWGPLFSPQLLHTSTTQPQTKPWLHPSRNTQQSQHGAISWKFVCFSKLGSWILSPGECDKIVGSLRYYKTGKPDHFPHACVGYT